MKTRNSSKIIFSLLALVLLPGLNVKAAIPELIQKEKQYITLNENEKKSFDNQIVQDGKIYQLQNASYNTVSKNPVKIKEKVTLVKKTKPKKQSTPYQAAKTITENNVTYTLIKVDKKEKKSKTTWKQTISAYSEYDSLRAAKEASNQKIVTVTDKKTGERVSVPCKKTGMKKTAEQWERSYIDILFSGYDADTFIWNNLKVKKNEKEPLKGYENELIQSVGGNPEKYKIQNISWKGKQYEKNGTLYRKARAIVKKKIPHYRVYYSGRITHKEKPSYVYTCTYTGFKEIESSEFSYVIDAKANYKLVHEKKEMPVIVITLAVVLVLVAVVGILFVILKKRNRERRK